ncbi:TPD1 protein homolog 1-like [Lycium ferocissimum]|uniref:TPD1 protein homolog 1-like n=1 Tax=Lycium ferocissimum TaxID=112874 RepID=UPI0028164346|nr:TPD1 protein homolog 1-like [Lycium ferocissimum]
MSHIHQKFFCFCFFLVIMIKSGNVKQNSFHPSISDKFFHQNGSRTTSSINTEKAYFTNRKLLSYGSCTNKDISIFQSQYSSTGIPQFMVEIINTCFTNCAPSNIHLNCGWFASARIVNPTTFKRLSYDDCLVNEGKPLKASQIIRFTYSNSFMYPLSFKSAKFC